MAIDELLTKGQTAEILHVTPKTLENWRGKGAGPKFVRIGGNKRGRIFYPKEQISAYLKSAVRASTSDQGSGNGKCP